MGPMNIETPYISSHMGPIYIETLDITIYIETPYTLYKNLMFGNNSRNRNKYTCFSLRCTIFSN